MRSACGSFLGCWHEDFRADHWNLLATLTSVSLGRRLLEALEFSVRSACGQRAVETVRFRLLHGDTQYMKTFSRARLGSLNRQRAHSGRSRALSPGPRVRFCRYEDCYRAPGVCSPRSPQRRRANCEGAPKVDGRRSEGGKGARKVDGRCFGPPAGRRELRGLVASCSKATFGRPPEGGWKALERYRRRSEGGRLRPSDQSHWG